MQSCAIAHGTRFAINAGPDARAAGTRTPTTGHKWGHAALMYDHCPRRYALDTKPLWLGHGNQRLHSNETRCGDGMAMRLVGMRMCALCWFTCCSISHRSISTVLLAQLVYRDQGGRSRGELPTKDKSAVKFPCTCATTEDDTSVHRCRVWVISGCVAGVHFGGAGDCRETQSVVITWQSPTLYKSSAGTTNLKTQHSHGS
jgi:hypothetical protein